MNRRIRFGVALAAMCVVAAVGAPVVLAAGDTDDHLSPANTHVKDTLRPGTTTSFTGQLGPITLTSNCTASTISFRTAAHGLGPVRASNPTFSGCTDSLHGTDTIKENSVNGHWTAKVVDAASDERAEKGPDHVRLTIPTAGGTVVSSLAPTCVITIAPSGPVAITGAFSSGKTTFKNVSIPYSTSAACPNGATTGTAAFSATYVSTPKVKVVS